MEQLHPSEQSTLRETTQVPLTGIVRQKKNQSAEMLRLIFGQCSRLGCERALSWRVEFNGWRLMCKFPGSKF